ncbi:hypothetical protein VTO42DRAFT_1137 [Malbranchea cinnamomea]
MPPFRNFLKRPTETVQLAIDEGQQTPAIPIGKADEGRQRPSLTIRRRRSKESDPGEYKMSVVTANGVYLPPSPPERRSFWRSSSRNKSRNLVDENEPFSISRESFDSYRRSFDISARSPVSQTDTAASRSSLDSRFSRLTPRSTYNGNGSLGPPELTAEETVFEEVRLTDDTKPKKKGLFARFGDTGADSQASSGENSRPSSSHLGFHFPGRKRAQSGQGAELTYMTMSGSKEAEQ